MLKKTKELIKSNNYHDREIKHANSLIAWYEGRQVDATRIWESILEQHPTDVSAIKFLHDAYFYLGDSKNIRDSIARVYNIWNTDFSNSKTFGYIQGMYAFGLEENYQFSEAEAMGRNALERNPIDAWATHAVSHVMEMQGRCVEGNKFLDSTNEYWTKCESISCHINWHNTLYLLELEKISRCISNI